MTQIKQEVREFPCSRYRNGALMYPGRYLITWIKAPFMPWLVADMRRVEGV